VAQVEENAKALELGPLSQSQVTEIREIMTAIEVEEDANF
jgi:hypothetical protein